MTMFLISLDELDRVKRMHGLKTVTDLARESGLSRNTWNLSLKDRKPRGAILDALADMGADETRVLVKVSSADFSPAA